VTSLAGKDADLSRLFLAEGLDLAHCEQTEQARLPRTPPPGFRHHWRGNDRHDLLGEEAGVQRPHTGSLRSAATSAPVS